MKKYLFKFKNILKSKKLFQDVILMLHRSINLRGQINEITKVGKVKNGIFIIIFFILTIFNIYFYMLDSQYMCSMISLCIVIISHYLYKEHTLVIFLLYIINSNTLVFLNRVIIHSESLNIPISTNIKAGIFILILSLIYYLLIYYLKEINYPNLKKIVYKSFILLFLFISFKFINLNYGNPISKYLVKNMSEKLIQEKYKSTSVKIRNIEYSRDYNYSYQVNIIKDNNENSPQELYCKFNFPFDVVFVDRSEIFNDKESNEKNDLIKIKSKLATKFYNLNVKVTHKSDITFKDMLREKGLNTKKMREVEVSLVLNSIPLNEFELSNLLKKIDITLNDKDYLVYKYNIVIKSANSIEEFSNLMKSDVTDINLENKLKELKNGKSYKQKDDSTLKYKKYLN